MPQALKHSGQGLNIISVKLISEIFMLCCALYRKESFLINNIIVHMYSTALTFALLSHLGMVDESICFVQLSCLQNNQAFFSYHYM